MFYLLLCSLWYPVILGRRIGLSVQRYYFFLLRMLDSYTPVQWDTCCSHHDNEYIYIYLTMTMRIHLDLLRYNVIMDRWISILGADTISSYCGCWTHTLQCYGILGIWITCTEFTTQCDFPVCRRFKVISDSNDYNTTEFVFIGASFYFTMTLQWHHDSVILSRYSNMEIWLMSSLALAWVSCWTNTLFDGNLRLNAVHVKSL